MNDCLQNIFDRISKWLYPFFSHKRLPLVYRGDVESVQNKNSHL